MTGLAGTLQQRPQWASQGAQRDGAGGNNEEDQGCRPGRACEMLLPPLSCGCARLVPLHSHGNPKLRESLWLDQDGAAPQGAGASWACGWGPWAQGSLLGQHSRDRNQVSGPTGPPALLGPARPLHCGGTEARSPDLTLCPQAALPCGGEAARLPLQALVMLPARGRDHGMPPCSASAPQHSLPTAQGQRQGYGAVLQGSPHSTWTGRWRLDLVHTMTTPTLSLLALG